MAYPETDIENTETYDVDSMKLIRRLRQLEELSRLEQVQIDALQTRISALERRENARRTRNVRQAGQ